MKTQNYDTSLLGVQKADAAANSAQAKCAGIVAALEVLNRDHAAAMDVISLTATKEKMRVSECQLEIATRELAVAEKARDEAHALHAPHAAAEAERLRIESEARLLGEGFALVDREYASLDSYTTAVRARDAFLATLIGTPSQRSVAASVSQYHEKRRVARLNAELGRPVVQSTRIA